MYIFLVIVVIFNNLFQVYIISRGASRWIYLVSHLNYFFLKWKILFSIQYHSVYHLFEMFCRITKSRPVLSITKKLTPREVKSLLMSLTLWDRSGGWGPSSWDLRSESPPGRGYLWPSTPFPVPTVVLQWGRPGAQSPVCLTEHAHQQLL